MCYKKWKFAFFADCKERKCIFNLDRNPVNRVNCLWTLDTLKFDGSIRVQFGQLCEARAIEEYWHHLAWHSSNLNGGRNPVCHLIANMFYSLRQLKVDTIAKIPRHHQLSLTIVHFHVSTKYLWRPTSPHSICIRYIDNQRQWVSKSQRGAICRQS